MTILTYINEWEKAIQAEIHHLKKYGSNKYLLKNGHLVSTENNYQYYFPSRNQLFIPIGAQIKLEYGKSTYEGTILSSDGSSVILSFENSIGDLISEAWLFYDPWELLDELYTRVGEIKKSKKKLSRVKKLLFPTHPLKPTSKESTSTVEKLYIQTKNNPVTFVWGPPGTGKTYTLARVAANHYVKGRRILLLSHSNQAVDVLVQELTAFTKRKNVYKTGEIIRYGQTPIHVDFDTTNKLIEENDPQLTSDRENLTEQRKLLKSDLNQSFSKRDYDTLLEVESKLSRLQERIRQKELKILEEAKVIGTTLAKAARDQNIYESDYDVVILDEASMAYIPQSAFAASLGKRIIICGDFKQLPPIASGRHPLIEKWLKEDVFNGAGIVESVSSDTLHPHLFLLKEQRRMHPHISSFTNKYIYHSLVGDHPTVGQARESIAEIEPFPKIASALLDTSFMGMNCITERTSGSRMNVWHLLLSFQLIYEAYKAGSTSIGYVTPYRAQAVLMESLLEGTLKKEREQATISAATVHRFQGSERDVMIYDSVDSFPFERPGMLLTGKNNDRLINVAVTRSKGKFIHVCDRHFITKTTSTNKTIRQLVKHQTEQRAIVSSEMIGKWIKNQHPKVKWFHARKTDFIFQDIKQAKKSVVISIPNSDKLPEEWTKELNAIKNNVIVKIMASPSMENLTKHTQTETDIPFPILIIDEEIFWLGAPVECIQHTRPPYVAIRVQSNHFIEQLTSQLNSFQNI
ncbi:AAA domain-containing protein [Bacillus sp. FJAT-45066]|uniref:AAA domain-containing protein n=1 Tax=Bacillus sp. FJAT-45066 TaxID=2011010 RepID=UPI000BB6A190|nr:AAA domain-containing protein [Bacillus sp. FJAT-45066]